MGNAGVAEVRGTRSEENESIACRSRAREPETHAQRSQGIDLLEEQDANQEQNYAWDNHQQEDIEAESDAEDDGGGRDKTDPRKPSAMSFMNGIH